MKKVIFALLMMMPLWLSAQDQDGLPNTLHVTLTDGTSQQYPLFESPEISFSGTDMVINNGNTTMVITRDNIVRYDFVYIDYASAEMVTTDKNLVRRGNEVYISNVCSGTPITIYSIDGRLLHQSVANERGEAAVSLDRLAHGIYLLTVNRFTTKIVKQ